MKKFIAPTIDLIKINPADIIATSLGISKDTTSHYQSRRDMDDWESDDFDFDLFDE